MRGMDWIVVWAAVAGVRVTLGETDAEFTTALPADFDVPGFLADLGYAALGWLAMEM